MRASRIQIAAYCTAVATTVDDVLTVNPATVLLSLISARTIPSAGTTHEVVFVVELEPTVGYCVVVAVVNLQALYVPAGTAMDSRDTYVMVPL
jgi:hypothetical protein